MTILKRTQFVIFLALLAIVGTRTQSMADTVGYTPSGTESDMGGNYGGGAFDFTVTSGIQVTQLGFYAISIGGGDTPQVYLWDVTTNTKLAQLGPLTGLTPNQYNYFSLPTPVTLTPGDVYQVSAPAYYTPTYPTSTTFTYGSGIVSDGFYRSSSDFFSSGWTQASPYTTAVFADVPTVANFEYIPLTPIPEPSSLAGSVVLGVGGLLTLLRYRGRRRA